MKLHVNGITLPVISHKVSTLGTFHWRNDPSKYYNYVDFGGYSFICGGNTNQDEFDHETPVANHWTVTSAKETFNIVAAYCRPNDFMPLVYAVDETDNTKLHVFHVTAAIFQYLNMYDC